VEEVDEVRRAMVEASRMVREREDALRSADRAKDEFLAMLGHELRNPLNAIGSAAQILQLSRPEGEHADSAVGIITRQVHHMRRLVDDLLDVSRVTSGRVKLSLQRIDLASRVRAALESLRASGRLEGHELRFDLAPVWIDADAARIEQIVVNLVGNAAKYTPPGGSIDVRVRQEGRQAVLEVVDTGRGLSPELLPRVFDLFVQGQRSLDRSEGGLGIGLTLVKRLVELHGGTVHAASEGPERGARFSVRLPAVEAPASLPRDAAGAELEIEPQRILVVEDNDDARQALVGALRLRGHETFEAPDGPAGLARAADCRPDVVIVDIGLPGIDGYEVGKRLRQTPGGAELVLLALTGYGQEESRQRALASGFDAFFIKPLSPERLLRRIASIRSERAHGVDDP
jgi:CheY-like chemotaxis protein/two-component sensor histidine kinase